MYGGGGRGGRGGKYAPKTYNTPGNNSNSNARSNNSNNSNTNSAPQDNYANSSQMQQGNQQQRQLPKQRVPPRSSGNNDQQQRQSPQQQQAQSPQSRHDARPVDWSSEPNFLTMKLNNNSGSANASTAGRAMPSNQPNNATSPIRQNANNTNNSHAPSSALSRPPTLQPTSLTPISPQSLPSVNLPMPNNNKFQHHFHSQSLPQPNHSAPQGSLSPHPQLAANAPFKPPSPRVPKLLTPMHGNVNLANNVNTNNIMTNNNSTSVNMHPQPSLSPLQLNSRSQAMNPMSPQKSLGNPQHSLQGYNARD